MLTKSFLHSLRDSYTKHMLEEINIPNVLNTSCPTVWELNGIEFDKEVNSKFDVLLMLTDYLPDIGSDNAIIDSLAENFSGKIHFFPQVNNDINYLQSLDSYKRKKARFNILDHTMNDFEELIVNNSQLIFVGTRLHGGIKCLQQNIPSLILSIDNRSEEIKKDINLPVIKRTEIGSILSWIKNEISLGKIALPNEDIKKWKSQFDNYK